MCIFLPTGIAYVEIFPRTRHYKHHSWSFPLPLWVVINVSNQANQQQFTLSREVAVFLAVDKGNEMALTPIWSGFCGGCVCDIISLSLAVLAVLKAMRGNLLFEYRIMFSTKALRNRAEGPSMHPTLYNQTKSEWILAPKVGSLVATSMTGGAFLHNNSPGWSES